MLTCLQKDAIIAARRALIYVLSRLGGEDLVNVVCFGSTSQALLPVSKRYAFAFCHTRLFTIVRRVQEVREGLLERLRRQDANLGNTDLGSALAPLLAQAAAAPSATRLRNILLFSDGRVSHLEPLLPILQRCTKAALRLFCFGAGSDISAHAMRTLARWGGGAYAPLDYSSGGSTYTTESRITQQLRR